jgi:hypothetical protein
MISSHGHKLLSSEKVPTSNFLHIVLCCSLFFYFLFLKNGFQIFIDHTKF